MKKSQRKAIFDAATGFISRVEKQASVEISIDGCEDTCTLDEVEDGVWVQTWVKVPKSAIPGYAMTPPAPAAVVETITMLMTYNEFAAKYRKAYEEGGEIVTNEQVSDSWAAYVRNPAGHFISK